jgi:membrane protease YdiL (CAAX protease family)
VCNLHGTSNLSQYDRSGKFFAARNDGRGYCARRRTPTRRFAAPPGHFSALQLVVVLRSGSTLPRLIAIKDQPTFHFRLICSYGLIVAFEFAQLLFVWYGIRKTNTTFSDLVGGRWSSAWDVVRDIFFAGALWLLWMIASIVLVIAIHPEQHGTPDYYKILPQSALEIGLWVAVSAAAGFCEEIVYRGYLQRQFLALWQKAPVAIISQAVVFAAIHRYQGAFNVLVIGVMAILFVTFAVRRKSLRPGIIAHVWHDGLIGVVFFLVHYYG